MLRISKLTDYGIVLLAHIVKFGDEKLFTARDLASQTGIPLPTVGKLLKLFSKGNLLNSQRGAKGGYQISGSASDIKISQVIALIEGPISITDCSHHLDGCEIGDTCPASSKWQKVNSVVVSALDKLSLRDMIPESEKPPASISPQVQDTKSLEAGIL